MAPAFVINCVPILPASLRTALQTLMGFVKMVIPQAVSIHVSSVPFKSAFQLFDGHEVVQ